ncbi:MAG: sugar ABC transporter permease [Chloroflexi bacterium]|nr:sugar ABC transporter permease [Chloroflexota bacterium]
MKPRASMIILFLMPAGLFYLALFLLPAAWAFYYSAFDWSGFSDEMTFVGLGNFVKLLTTDPIFWSSFGNTLKIIFVGGFFTFTLAFLLAMLLNSGIKGKKVFRALIFLPNVIATIALTTMWSFAIFSPRSGVLPNFLKLIGWTSASKFLWMSADHVFWSMLIAIVWINVGYFVVLILAGMDRIPIEFYEAAQLDGASMIQQFFRITLPLMWDVLTVSVVLWSISAIKVFEFPFAYMGAGEDPNLYTIGVYLYIMGFGKRQPIYQLGYATAIGVLMLLLIIVVSIFVRRLMQRESLQY